MAISVHNLFGVFDVTRKEFQAHMYADKVLELADRIEFVKDEAEIPRLKAKIEKLKQRAAMLDPKKWS